jgi:hypothetical protein
MKYEEVDINQQWKNGCCPLINGIALNNGDVYWINIDLTYTDLKPTYNLSEPKQTSLNELVGEGFDEWVSCCPLTNKVIAEKHICVFAGEGGMGADGFVGVEDLDTGNIQWVAFFDCSNPFVEVEIKENILTVTSSYGNHWKFPLDAPQRVQVD